MIHIGPEANLKPLPDLELYLVTHSLAICLVLAKYSNVLMNGGDFLTWEILDIGKWKNLDIWIVTQLEAN